MQRGTIAIIITTETVTLMTERLATTGCKHNYHNDNRQVHSDDGDDKNNDSDDAAANLKRLTARARVAMSQGCKATNLIPNKLDC